MLECVYITRAIKDWVQDICDKICVTLRYNISTSVHAMDLTHKLYRRVIITLSKIHEPRP